MQTLFIILLMMLIAIPVFAVFMLLHRLEKHKIDEEAPDRFFRALCDEYSVGNSTQKPERVLTEEERIALAKKIAENPFADVTVNDVITEQSGEDTGPEEKPVGEDTDSEEKSAEENTVSEEKVTSVNAAEEKKLSREEALAMVSTMLGSSRNKKKGSAFSELQETLSKYSKK
ncbi:MAG: hypothetical protein ACI4KB_05320 [Oscillospiraceae bacterium]|nr:hypothetical protein [Oscillospiraceae bacterium]